jgi:hypothetical protein
MTRCNYLYLCKMPDTKWNLDCSWISAFPSSFVPSDPPICRPLSGSV